MKKKHRSEGKWWQYLICGLMMAVPFWMILLKL